MEKVQVTYKDRPIRITSDFSMENMKDRRSWTDVLQTLRDQGLKPKYHTQQSYQSPSIEKTRYSMPKPDLINTYLQIQSYRKYQKENSNPRKLTATMKTQAIDNLTPENPKEGKHTNTVVEITEINNHWSLISLSINGLNLSIK